MVTNIESTFFLLSFDKKEVDAKDLNHSKGHQKTISRYTNSGDELRAHLDGEPLVKLQETVQQALDLGRAAKVSRLNINGCDCSRLNHWALSVHLN